MITNLLDQNVIYNGVDGRIRGVYMHEGVVYFIVITDDGTIHERVIVESLKVVHGGCYQVILFWTLQNKINAIKIVRHANNMDLKAAKEYVESHPGAMVVKSNMTKDDADELKRQIELDNGLKCEVRREV